MTDPAPLPRHPLGDWPTLQPGCVWLVGAGPGDPGLMTLHAVNALRQADAVVYDALVEPGILEWANPAAQLILAGKRGGRPSPKQRDISLTLVDLARAGKRVVRLKGGDPFLFGRGGEEAETLVAEGVPFRVAPGITAGIGGLAYAGVPATHRDVNQTLTFVTGHDQTGEAPGADWAALARGSQVIVIYMGMKHLAKIAAALIAGGRSPEEPVLIVREATTPRQMTLETTLAAADAAAKASGVLAPAIICVGPAVRLRDALGWLEDRSGGAPPIDLET
ncbi:MAG: uroporphyrinogen-III C-methyltransferase [Pseudomonadota bacterium]